MQGFATKPNPYPWDGRNGVGEVVGNGGYIFQIIAVDGQGHKTKAIHKVGVVK
jgi:hypothetical protein